MGILAWKVGRDTLDIQLNDEMFLYQFLQRLDAEFDINPSAVLVKLNGNLVSPFMFDKIKLKSGDVISVFLPVSGG